MIEAEARPGLTRRDGVPERQRLRDGRNGFLAFANTQDGDVAVIEKPSHDGLVDVDALDLVEGDLEGTALDETGFMHDAAIGDVRLSREAVEPGPDRPIQRQNGE